MTRERIVLAMSGGVDSSVAAHLLVEAGHDVIGVFMRHGETPPVRCSPAESGPAVDAPLPILGERLDHKQGCCSAADAADARRVADRLGIPFYALDLQADFRRIVDYFVDEYAQGRTPNPCVKCNHWIKFGRLFDYADGVGADAVATGHYAQLRSGEGGEPPALLRGVDRRKDQSYALFGIDASLLPRMRLPVGGYRKPDIRRLAAERGLDVAGKRDSQEICFVTSGRHAEFVQARSGADRGGEIVTTSGEVVGTHEGIEHFTIGQRKGLGVALGEPRFVVRLEPEARRVVIGCHDELARHQLLADRTNWLDPPPAGPFRCQVQIRYNSDAQEASVECCDDGTLRVSFDQPGYGVAPGQAVVCYDGDRVLGGGWIVR